MHCCQTHASAMQVCGEKLTRFCCVWVDFALAMDPQISECECNFKSLLFHAQIKSVIHNRPNKVRVGLRYAWN